MAHRIPASLRSRSRLEVTLVHRCAWCYCPTGGSILRRTLHSAAPDHPRPCVEEMQTDLSTVRGRRRRLRPTLAFRRMYSFTIWRLRRTEVSSLWDALIWSTD